MVLLTLGKINSNTKEIEMIETIQSYIFLSQEGTTLAPNDNGIPLEIDNLQVIDIISASSPDKAFLELKRNNTNLVDIGFRDLFCYTLDMDYIKNRMDYSL